MVGGRPSANRDIAFNAYHTRNAGLRTGRTIPLESSAHYPLRAAWNAPPTGEKIGDLYALKSSCNERDVALNGYGLSNYCSIVSL